VAATAPDKDYRDAQGDSELVSTLIDGEGGLILVGGQQRVCSVMRDDSVAQRLPLPFGKSNGFHTSNDKHLVKWVLLTPAIFPHINDHPGGWLPSWIDQTNGEVMLLDGPGENAARRRILPPGKPIAATLAAHVPATNLPLSANRPRRSQTAATKPPP
jgi:hypothetical protein